MQVQEVSQDAQLNKVLADKLAESWCQAEQVAYDSCMDTVSVQELASANLEHALICLTFSFAHTQCTATPGSAMLVGNTSLAVGVFIVAGSNRLVKQIAYKHKVFKQASCTR